jgi:hypothetical protein
LTAKYTAYPHIPPLENLMSKPSSPLYINAGFVALVPWYKNVSSGSF